MDTWNPGSEYDWYCVRAVLLHDHDDDDDDDAVLWYIL